jgi:hypothetical protein
MERDSLVGIDRSQATKHAPSTEVKGSSATSVNSSNGWFARFRSRYPFFKKKRGIALLAFLAGLPLLGLLGLLALRRGGVSGDLGQGQSGAISSDTYFYGQSEPVYPSRMF